MVVNQTNVWHHQQSQCEHNRSLLSLVKASLHLLNSLEQIEFLFFPL